MVIMTVGQGHPFLINGARAPCVLGRLYEHRFSYWATSRLKISVPN